MIAPPHPARHGAGCAPWHAREGPRGLLLSSCRSAHERRFLARSSSGERSLARAAAARWATDCDLDPRDRPRRAGRCNPDRSGRCQAWRCGWHPAPGARAPQTSMPLVLTGIIAGNDPQNGLAILGQSAQTTKVYAVGDSVPGGAKLHSVYSDRVVIDREGQLESLSLPRQVTPGSARPPSTAVLQNENPAIERMRRMISEQPGLLADVLRPQPVMDHNRMNGFRVYPGRNRAAFTRLGLQPGDQVTAINGTPLDDRDRGEQILRTLSSSSEARVTLIRKGQQQDLTLNIAQVAQEADSLPTQSPAPSSGGSPAAAEQPPLPPPPPAEALGGDGSNQ